MDSAWLLLDTKPTLKEFLNGPLIYSAIYDFGISKVFPETFEITTGKNDTVNFRFNNNSNKIIEKVQLQIKGPNKMDSVEPQLYQDSTGLYCVDHVFKTKGTHTVHILVNGSFAFTYNVSCR
jgi:hypothetical protein